MDDDPMYAYQRVEAPPVVITCDLCGSDQVTVDADRPRHMTMREYIALAQHPAAAPGGRAVRRHTLRCAACAYRTDFLAG